MTTTYTVGNRLGILLLNPCADWQFSTYADGTPFWVILGSLHIHWQLRNGTAAVQQDAWSPCAWYLNGTDAYALFSPNWEIVYGGHVDLLTGNVTTGISVNRPSSYFARSCSFVASSNATTNSIVFVRWNDTDWGLALLDIATLQVSYVPLTSSVKVPHEIGYGDDPEASVKCSALCVSTLLL